MASQEGISADQTVSSSVEEWLEATTILHTLERLGTCSKLLDLVRGSQLEYVLERGGLNTLFAPSNDALGTAPLATPERFINDHLVKGGFHSYDLRQAKQVKTESSQILAIQTQNGQIRIGPATIVQSDVVCTNGVVQVIDHVLSPVA